MSNKEKEISEIIKIFNKGEDNYELEYRLKI